MKKIIVILTLLITTQIELKAQQQEQFAVVTNFKTLKTAATTIYTLSDSPVVVKDYAYYMHKSKDLRTAGLVTLGTGLVLSGIGLLVIGGSGYNESNAGFGLAMMGLGAISGIISIPLMISGHVTRNKAKVLLKNQKTGFGLPQNVDRNITGITFQIPIGK